MIANDPYVIISPSDHLVKNEKLFTELLKKSAKICKRQFIINRLQTDKPTHRIWLISAKLITIKNYLK